MSGSCVVRLAFKVAFNVHPTVSRFGRFFFLIGSQQPFFSWLAFILLAYDSKVCIRLQLDAIVTFLHDFHAVNDVLKVIKNFWMLLDNLCKTCLLVSPYKGNVTNAMMMKCACSFTFLL